jgi:hypothetical protein
MQLYKNIYKLNNAHKLNKQRHSNNIQIKWKQIQTCHLLFTKFWKSPFWYDPNETISEKGNRKHKSTSEIKFCEGVRDKYIPLKREYIKSLNGRSNVQLMVAKYGV